MNESLTKVWFAPTRGASNWLWLSFFVVLLDQVTKAMVVSSIKFKSSFALLPILEIVYLENRGAAFSILHDAAGWQRWFFIGLAIVVSLALMIWLRRIRADQTILAIGLALVLGGALGNVIDRVRQRLTMTGPGEWVLGRGWDQNDWSTQQWPTHEPLAPMHGFGLRIFATLAVSHAFVSTLRHGHRLKADASS